VWLDKTGQLQDSPPTPAMELGTLLEMSVLAWAEKILGKIKRNQFRVCKELPIHANIDAIVLKDGSPVEAKTSGIMSPTREEWGDENTDEIPPRVIVQCQVHMMCHPSEMCHVPVLLGGRGMALFWVSRNHALQKIIRAAAKDFWEFHVAKHVPPIDSMPNIDVVRSIRRVPNKVVEIDPELATEWDVAKEYLAKARKDKEECDAAVLAAMGDAQAATWGDKEWFTFYEQTRKAYTVEEKTFPVLRKTKKK
jgi:hypothetical protein